MSVYLRMELHFVRCLFINDVVKEEGNCLQMSVYQRCCRGGGSSGRRDFVYRGSAVPIAVVLLLRMRDGVSVRMTDVRTTDDVVHEEVKCSSMCP